MLIRQDELTLDALRRLFSGEALALQVSNYYGPQAAQDVGDRLVSLVASSNGSARIYESNVRTFTDAATDDNAQDAYLARSQPAIAAVRRAFDPGKSPIDQLRCELDELWPGGANLLRVRDRSLVFGMVRVWRDGAEALPHYDILKEVAPEVGADLGIREQLGANIYVRVPEGGGQGTVEMWDLDLTATDAARHGIAGTYGFRRDLLPVPTCVIDPRAGDLVLLRSTKLHAVRPTVTGERVTLSGFIGYANEATPLWMWS